MKHLSRRDRNSINNKRARRLQTIFVKRQLQHPLPMSALDAWQTTNMPEPASVNSRDLDRIRAERDALRRELGDLRAWLSVRLALITRSPGPEGLTVLGVASDQEIFAKIEQLVKNAND